MLFTIRIYYDIKNKQDYNTFYNIILEQYLIKGFSIIKDQKDYSERFTNLEKLSNQNIKIIACPLREIDVIGQHPNIIYIQNTALWKTNHEIINLFNQINPKDTDIYVFDRTGVIGTWNIK